MPVVLDRLRPARGRRRATCDGEPLSERRALLDALLHRGVATTVFIPSPVVTLDAWDDARTAYAGARERCAEGLMLKRRDSVYGVGRTEGRLVEVEGGAVHVDAVMIYAQPGHGRRASLHTDYTFAVWDGWRAGAVREGVLGADGCGDPRGGRWIRANTVEKFGPVRHVKPEQVFELGFEGIQPSPRHKSGRGGAVSAHAPLADGQERGSDSWTRCETLLEAR